MGILRFRPLKPHGITFAKPHTCVSFSYSLLRGPTLITHGIDALILRPDNVPGLCMNNAKCQYVICKVKCSVAARPFVWDNKVGQRSRDCIFSGSSNWACVKEKRRSNDSKFIHPIEENWDCTAHKKMVGLLQRKSGRTKLYSLF